VAQALTKWRTADPAAAAQPEEFCHGYRVTSRLAEAHPLSIHLITSSPTSPTGVGHLGETAGQTPASPWAWIATLIAAVIAAVAAITGAVLQRRSGREAADAAHKSAAAAERAAKAAENSAKASQRLASVAEQEFEAAESARRDDAMVELIKRFMSPTRFPGEHEPLSRLNDYSRELGEWHELTNDAIAATWKWMYGLPEFEPLRGVRRKLEERIKDVQKDIASLQLAIPRELARKAPISEIRQSSKGNLVDQLDALLRSVEELKKLGTENVQAIRLLLRD
jgi:chromosome segregation ATPase